MKILRKIIRLQKNKLLLKIAKRMLKKEIADLNKTYRNKQFKYNGYNGECDYIGEVDYVNVIIPMNKLYDAKLSDCEIVVVSKKSLMYYLNEIKLIN